MYIKLSSIFNKVNLIEAELKLKKLMKARKMHVIICKSQNMKRKKLCPLMGEDRVMLYIENEKK